MQSFLKEFQLPLDQSHNTVSLFHQFQHDRSNSTNCHSSQQKRRTIQEILKQQIHHNRAFKSALNSVHTSPLRDNICTSPKSSMKNSQFNKTFVQECQSPSNTKKMFLIVTDFNNKHYKIISNTKEDTASQKKHNQSSPSDDKGILLSNLRLKQAFIGNIRFESEGDQKNISNLQIKNRPKTVVNSLDTKKRSISNKSNSSGYYNKNKLNQTLRDSVSRQNQSFHDNTSSNQIQLQIDLLKAMEAQNTSSSYQFPANMPVKTRKYRLKKEDLVEKIFNEQRQKECHQIKEKLRSVTQHTQNDLNSSFNKEQYLDSIINSQSPFKNHYEGYNPTQNSLICKGTRPFSTYNSPITKRERYSKIMNQSAQISKEPLNLTNNSQSELQARSSQEQKSYQDLIDDKLIQSQLTVTPERIILPQKYGVKYDLKQQINKSDQKPQNNSNHFNTTKDQINNTITQNNTENSIYQVQFEDKKYQFQNHYQNKNSRNNSNQKNSDSCQIENYPQTSQYNRYQPLKKQDTIKYKFYNQFYKQPQMQRLFNEFENQDIEKQENLKTNDSAGNQCNYFSYNKIFE